MKHTPEINLLLPIFESLAVLHMPISTCVHRPTGQIVETRDVVFDEGDGSELERVEIDLPASKTASDLSDKSSDEGESEGGDWESVMDPLGSLDEAPMASDQKRSQSESKMPQKASTTPTTPPYAPAAKRSSRTASRSISSANSASSSQKISSGASSANA